MSIREFLPIADVSALLSAPVAVAGITALALLAAAWVGAFRRNSVLGPERVGRDDLRALLVTIAIGWAVWLIAPGIYLGIAHADQLRARESGEVATTQSTTQATAQPTTHAATDPATHPTTMRPATQPGALHSGFQMSQREQVILGGGGQVVALLALLFADARLLRQGARKLGFVGRPLRIIVFAAIVGSVIAILLTGAASSVVQFVWQRFSPIQPRDHELIRIIRDVPDLAVHVMIVVSAVIIAPLFEETLFRGHIQTAFAATFRVTSERLLPRPTHPERWDGLAQASRDPGAALDYASASDIPTEAERPWCRWLAIFVAAAMFAGVHTAGAGSWWMLPPLFLLAVCFGYAYERTGSIWVPILMHAAFNATSLVSVML